MVLFREPKQERLKINGGRSFINKRVEAQFHFRPCREVPPGILVKASTSAKDPFLGQHKEENFCKLLGSGLKINS